MSILQSVATWKAKVPRRWRGWSPVIKSHWPSKSDSLGIPRPLAASPGWKAWYGAKNLHNSARTSSISLFSRLWVSHPEGIGFYFIVIVPLLLFHCGFSFVLGSWLPVVFPLLWLCRRRLRATLRDVGMELGHLWAPRGVLIVISKAPGARLFCLQDYYTHVMLCSRSCTFLLTSHLHISHTLACFTFSSSIAFKT